MSIAINRVQSFSSTSGHFYALDASRALALILGVFYHTIESFISYTPSEGYPTQDAVTSPVLDFAFYALHTFRMQAFFLIAGFFAHQIYHRRGAMIFLEYRFKRLMIPFIAFWPLIYYLLRILYIWGRRRLGNYADLFDHDTVSPWLAAGKELLTGQWFKFNGLILPLYHLWFLYYLMLFCCCAVLIRPLIVYVLVSTGSLRQQFDDILSWIMHQWWAAIGLGVFVALAMTREKYLFGVDTPNQNLIPNTRPFLVYVLFFGLGWLLRRQSNLLKQLRIYRRTTLLLSLILLVGLYTYFLAYHQRVELMSPASEAPIEDYIYKAIYGVASTGAVFTFLGYMITLFPGPIIGMKYLVDASYWIYLMHLPVVIALQIWVSDLLWPWPLKVILIFGVSLLLLLASYHVGVRRTWLGILLKGKKS